MPEETKSFKRRLKREYRKTLDRLIRSNALERINRSRVLRYSRFKRLLKLLVSSGKARQII